MADADRSLPITKEHREFTVLCDGQEVGREHQLVSVAVHHAANRISFSTLVYVDGEAARADFPLSNSALFAPGTKVEIFAGVGGERSRLFVGIVVKVAIKASDHAAPMLRIECRHAAFRLHLADESQAYFDQTDSEVMEALLARHNLPGTVAATSLRHAQLIQYRATAWDYLLTRAEANGFWLRCEDEQLHIEPPPRSSAAVLALQYGATILEFEASVDARQQYAVSRVDSWDAAQQARTTAESDADHLASPGNFARAALAGVGAAAAQVWQHSALGAEEAQALADAAQSKNQLGLAQAELRCEGVAALKPGVFITLAGLGERYSGAALVTATAQHFDANTGWRSSLRIGMAPDWFGDAPSVHRTAASGLLPSVSGLQIGVVTGLEDPTGEDRVRIQLPLVDGSAEGAWARLASLDAGKDRGWVQRPEVGDEVVVGFFDNDPRRPVVLGMVHSSAHPAWAPGKDDNPQKGYQSREQLQLLFDDEKKSIVIATPAGNQLQLSEDAGAVQLQDQHGNRIVMDADGIRIESHKKLVLSAEMGVELKAGLGLTAESGTELSLSGGTTAEVASAGVTSVKGATVMLG